jgi:hypothetical protein
MNYLCDDSEADKDTALSSRRAALQSDFDSLCENLGSQYKLVNSASAKAQEFMHKKAWSVVNAITSGVSPYSERLQGTTDDELMSCISANMRFKHVPYYGEVIAYLPVPEESKRDMTDAIIAGLSRHGVQCRSYKPDIAASASGTAGSEDRRG